MGDGQTSWDILSAVRHTPSKIIENVKSTIEEHHYNRRLEELVGSNGNRLREFKRLVPYTLVGETKNRENKYHPLRVAMYCGFIAEKLGRPREEVMAVRRMGFIHDAGKFFVDYVVLNKPGKLTKGEWEEINSHIPLGVRLAKRLGVQSRILKEEILAVGVNIIRYHHENYDGSGLYKIKGNKIPLEGRIIRLADIYDACREPRSYKEAFSHKKTRRIFAKGDDKVKPRFLDPDILDIFFKHDTEFKDMYDHFRI